MKQFVKARMMEKADEAVDAVANAAPFLELLDAACIANQVRVLSISGAAHGTGYGYGVDTQIDKILDEPSSPPPPKAEQAEKAALPAKRKKADKAATNMPHGHPFVERPAIVDPSAAESAEARESA